MINITISEDSLIHEFKNSTKEDQHNIIKDLIGKDGNEFSKFLKDLYIDAVTSGDKKYQKIFEEFVKSKPNDL